MINLSSKLNPAINNSHYQPVGEWEGNFLQVLVCLNEERVLGRDVSRFKPARICSIDGILSKRVTPESDSDRIKESINQ